MKKNKLMIDRIIDNKEEIIVNNTDNKKIANGKMINDWVIVNNKVMGLGTSGEEIK